MSQWIPAAITYLSKQKPEVVLLFLMFAAICFGLYHLPATQERLILRQEERHTEQLRMSTGAYEADQQRDHEMRKLMIEHFGHVAMPPLEGPIVLQAN